MDRHLTTFTEIVDITNTLVEHISNSVASVNDSTLFSVLRENQIFEFKGSTNTNSGGLFTKGRHVERNLTLSLGHVQDSVDFFNLNHGIEDSIQDIVGDIFVLRRSNKISLQIDDSESRNGWRLSGCIELESVDFFTIIESLVMLHVTESILVDTLERSSL